MLRARQYSMSWQKQLEVLLKEERETEEIVIEETLGWEETGW